MFFGNFAGGSMAGSADMVGATTLSVNFVSEATTETGTDAASGFGSSGGLRNCRIAGRIRLLSVFDSTCRIPDFCASVST